MSLENLAKRLSDAGWQEPHWMTLIYIFPLWVAYLVSLTLGAMSLSYSDWSVPFGFTVVAGGFFLLFFGLSYYTDWETASRAPLEYIRFHHALTVWALKDGKIWIQLERDSIIIDADEFLRVIKDPDIESMTLRHIDLGIHPADKYISRNADPVSPAVEPTPTPEVEEESEPEPITPPKPKVPRRPLKTWLSDQALAFHRHLAPDEVRATFTPNSEPTNVQPGTNPPSDTAPGTTPAEKGSPPNSTPIPGTTKDPSGTVSPSNTPPGTTSQEKGTSDSEACITITDTDTKVPKNERLVPRRVRRHLKVP